MAIRSSSEGGVARLRRLKGQDMRIFISWSGRRSHEVADALAGWLRKVIQSAEPWVSSEMERGVKWLAEISKSLDAHSIGILCVTPGNVGAPWLNFEAGALSKQIGDDVRVIPYLLDFRSVGELQPPLGQFNASLADESGTYDLVKTLNAHSEPRLSDADLDETFKMWWPSLRAKLEAIRASKGGHPPERRTTDDKINELLDLTRQLIRQVPTLPTSGELGSLVTRLGNIGVHGDLSPSNVLLLTTNYDQLLGGTALRGEGILSAGGSVRQATRQEAASGVIAEVLRQAGQDVNAMGVMKTDELSVWIYVPHSLDHSLLQMVRAALKRTLPNSPKVDFYTSGETEMKLIDAEPEEPSEEPG
jgi:hypothetical protein